MISAATWALRIGLVVGLFAFLGLLAWGISDASRQAAICEQEMDGLWTRIGCIVGDFQIIEDPTSPNTRQENDRG